MLALRAASMSSQCLFEVSRNFAQILKKGKGTYGARSLPMEISQSKTIKNMLLSRMQ